MTSDHTLELTLSAAPDLVFSALATPAGLRRWWTKGAEGSSEVGGRLRLSFGEDHWTEMRIDELDPAREVRWSCVAQHESGFARPDEWVGSSMTFRLEPAPDGGTTLHFAHHGLPALKCYELCRRGWDFYVGQSLRALVEDGKGSPDLRSDARASR